MPTIKPADLDPTLFLEAAEIIEQAASGGPEAQVVTDIFACTALSMAALCRETGSDLHALLMANSRPPERQWFQDFFAPSHSHNEGGVPWVFEQHDDSPRYEKDVKNKRKYADIRIMALCLAAAIVRDAISEAGKLNAINFDERVDELFQKNTLNSHAAGDGYFYETHGAERQYVNEVHAIEPGRICTIIECDGRLYVSRGYHFVNRLYYLVAKPGVTLPAFKDFRYA